MLFYYYKSTWRQVSDLDLIQGVGMSAARALKKMVTCREAVHDSKGRLEMSAKIRHVSYEKDTLLGCPWKLVTS